MLGRIIKLSLFKRAAQAHQNDYFKNSSKYLSVNNSCLKLVIEMPQSSKKF